MKKAATLLSVPEVFKDRFFKIPDYQRGYSWEVDPQLLDLRKDIENIYSKNYKHFTGTIVAAKINGSENHLEIVDGQQRLTTLVILLKEIYRTDPIKYALLDELFFKRGAIGNEENVLTPNEETRIFFNELILGTGLPQAKVKSHTFIAEAQEFFRNWLKEKPENTEMIYKVVVEKIGFILFTPQNEKEIGIMFEVINNRGKKLSELEKIKNYFIYFATIYEKDTLRKTINDKWYEILENLSISDKTSNDDEDSFIRFCYIVFYEANKEKSHHVYEQLKMRYSPQETDKEKINNQVTQIKNFIAFLTDASRYYTYFFKSGNYMSQINTDHIQAKRISKTLTYFRCHPVNASIMPLYLAVMNSFNQPQPDGLSDTSKHVAGLLELMEIVNFRLYLLPGVFFRADTKQGDLFSFANDFFKNPEWIADPKEPTYAKYNEEMLHKGNIYDWLEVELIAMVQKHCPVSKFVDALTIDENEDYNFYNWRDSGLRYFFARYEENLKLKNKLDFDMNRLLIKRNEVKQTQNDYLSIEHIWASENRNPPFQRLHKEKRRLGNFILMGMSANIQQNNDDIPDKVENLQYENKIGRGSLDMHQVAEIKGQLKDVLESKRIKDWSRKTDNYYREMAMALNDLRETKIIKFALSNWAIKGDDIAEFIEVNSFKALEERRNQNYYLNI